MFRPPDWLVFFHPLAGQETHILLGMTQSPNSTRNQSIPSGITYQDQIIGDLSNRCRSTVYYAKAERTVCGLHIRALSLCTLTLSVDTDPRPPVKMYGSRPAGYQHNATQAVGENVIIIFFLSCF